MVEVLIKELISF